MSVRYHNRDRLDSSRRYYRLIVMAAGSLLLLIRSLQTLPSAGQLWAVLILTPFVAYQFVFPIQLSFNEIYIFHVITLGGGLIYGHVAAGWAATLGVFLGYPIRKYGSNGALVRSIPAPPAWSETCFTVGLYNTSLFLALHVSGWDAGITSNRG